MPNLPPIYSTPLSALPNHANLTPMEVARFLAISLTLVYELINNGDLPHRRIGKKIIRINREKFIAWYETYEKTLSA